jgi:hypothetical protein
MICGIPHAFANDSSKLTRAEGLPVAKLTPAHVAVQLKRRLGGAICAASQGRPLFVRRRDHSDDCR